MADRQYMSTIENEIYNMWSCGKKSFFMCREVSLRGNHILLGSTIQE